MNGAMVVSTIVWLNVVNHFGYGGNGVASNLVNPSIVYHNIIACACQHILIVSPCGSSILISLSLMIIVLQCYGTMLSPPHLSPKLISKWQ